MCIYIHIYTYIYIYIYIYMYMYVFTSMFIWHVYVCVQKRLCLWVNTKHLGMNQIGQVSQHPQHLAAV